ncbi:hypothetical protein ACTA71_008779 [Dictyostelium dimigraforme]
MSRLLYFISSVLFLINFVNSQISTSNCSFNGIDYSGLSDTIFSAINLPTLSTSTPSQFTYYWGICSSPSVCLSDGVSACQTERNNRNPPIPVGLVNLGKFQIINSTIQLSYSTYLTCITNGNYRTFNVALICSEDEKIQISQVKEDNCIYSVEMAGKDLCGKVNPPTPQPLNNEVTCQSTNGIIMTSQSNIECIGYGPTRCQTSSGYVCESIQPDGITKCISPDNSISCIGDRFICSTVSYTCSIDLKTYDGLEVNDKYINSTYFSST